MLRFSYRDGRRIYQVTKFLSQTSVPSVTLGVGLTKCIYLQAAAKNKDVHAYEEYTKSAHESTKNCTLRGQLEFNYAAEALDLDQVESAASIVKRFCTGKSDPLTTSGHS